MGCLKFFFLQSLTELLEDDFQMYPLIELLKP